MNQMQDFQTNGFHLEKQAFQASAVESIRDELLKVGNALGVAGEFRDLDALWNFHRERDRSRASALYNGFKYLASIQRLASSEVMHRYLRVVCGIQFPALVDVNCRIDSSGEEKYLFDWHQDYWFSICSPRAVVVWVPIMPLTPDLGGLQVISNAHTGGRLFKTKSSSNYHSYADAVVLNEEIPAVPVVEVNEMNPGDMLFFAFNVLHKSIPIQSAHRSRFTVQLRFADFMDPGFIGEKFRPGTINSTTIDYVKRGIS